jgi:hypothetical protein
MDIAQCCKRAQTRECGMAFRHSKSFWADTTQRQLLLHLQDNAAPTAFIPLDDRRSFAAYRTNLSDVLGSPLLLNFWFVLPVVVPFITAYWFWRRTRPKPGWLVDWAGLKVQAVGQKQTATFQLSPEMGLLAHHRQIDITHPTRGPVLTLFTVAASSDPLNHSAQEALARTLAEKLHLRLVGCRVALK